jgi:hypothetical protein
MRPIFYSGLGLEGLLDAGQVAWRLACGAMPWSVTQIGSGPEG